MDWGHTDLFEVIRGEGECAVGDLPMVRDAVPVGNTAVDLN